MLTMMLLMKIYLIIQFYLIVYEGDSNNKWILLTTACMKVLNDSSPVVIKSKNCWSSNHGLVW